MKSRIENELSKALLILKGTFLGNRIDAYWYTGEVNFGDLITPLLLKHYGFTPIKCNLTKAKVLCTGSILDTAPVGFSGHILGSGLIRDERREFNSAKIWALRGPLTRERVSAPKATALGDPGLLIPLLLNERQGKKHLLGVVPHYVDKDHGWVSGLEERFGDEVLIIDVMRSPDEVIKEIDSCKYILSSSLHGIIISDSLGIPNAWVHLTDRVVGKGFKFKDYFASIGREHEPIHPQIGQPLKDLLCRTQEPSPRVEKARLELDEVFQEFKNSLL